MTPHTHTHTYLYMFLQLNVHQLLISSVFGSYYNARNCRGQVMITYTILGGSLLKL